MTHMSVSGSAYYKVLVYCTTRREELEKEMEPFEGTCSPEEIALARTLEELNGVINFIIEQAGA